MAKKPKIPGFAEKMRIGKHLPSALQTYLRTANLEEGRQALKTFRATKKLPKTLLQKGEAAIVDEYGGAGKLMRGGKKARKRR